MLNRKFNASTLLPLLLFCFVFVYASPCQAQQTDCQGHQPDCLTSINSLTQEEKNVPAQQVDAPLEFHPVAEPEKLSHIFDQYGAVNEEDEMARLDYFAIELQQDPKVKGYIIFYHGQHELPGRLSEQRGERALDYLMNTRGLDEARVSLIKGGFREEQTTELWVVPEGAPAPEPMNTLAYIKPTRRTYQFDEHYLEIRYLEFESEDEPEDSSEAEGDDASTPAPDTKQSEPVEEPVTDAAYQARIEQETLDTFVPETSLDWASEQYAEAVKQEDGAQACIIYYADYDHLDFAQMQTAIERGKEALIENYGLKAESIVIIYGGYRETPTVDTWVVPANAALPAPTPEENKTDEMEEEVIAPQPS